MLMLCAKTREEINVQLGQLVSALYYVEKQQQQQPLFTPFSTMSVTLNKALSYICNLLHSLT